MPLVDESRSEPTKKAQYISDSVRHPHLQQHFSYLDKLVPYPLEGCIGPQALVCFNLAPAMTNG